MQRRDFKRKKNHWNLTAVLKNIVLIPIYEKKSGKMCSVSHKQTRSRSYLIHSVTHTYIPSDDWRSHHQCYELVQYQMHKLYKILSFRIVYVHDASLQLILKTHLTHASRNLLLLHPCVEIHEAIYVLILSTERRIHFKQCIHQSHL